jgi:hypothetical protein
MSNVTDIAIRSGSQPQQQGVIAREEFGANEVARRNETAMAAVTARETAIVQAEYIYAERHPRVWAQVEVDMLSHCSRPRFAEIARYAKPIGREKVNGEWVEKKAEGFSARFAETLAQEMGNIKPVSAVTYEDDLIRVVRIGVTDLQKNIPRSREVTFAKAVEKRGKKRGNSWDPPEGREIISQRTNSYGEPTFLCKATEDEMRSKVNSEESKTQRDFVLKLCPRDILESCLDKVLEVKDQIRQGYVKDPQAAMKKVVSRFAELGIQPSDLEAYIGRSAKHFTAGDIEDLIDLGTAIRDNQTTFQQAMRDKYAEPAPDGEETPQQRDARKQQQMADQAEEAKREALKVDEGKKMKAAAETEKVETRTSEENKTQPTTVAEESQPSTGRWPSHAAMVADLNAKEAALGSELFWKILGSNGIGSEEDITLNAKGVVDSAVEMDKVLTPPAQAEKPAHREAEKPVFGRKGR